MLTLTIKTFYFIPRCHKALEPKGINLTKIITEADPKIYDNILNSFIGIAAVQIGLTDILKAIDIEPDFIIGNMFLNVHYRFEVLLSVVCRH